MPRLDELLVERGLAAELLRLKRTTLVEKLKRHKREEEDVAAANAADIGVSSRA